MCGALVIQHDARSLPLDDGNYNWVGVLLDNSTCIILIAFGYSVRTSFTVSDDSVFVMLSGRFEIKNTCNLWVVSKPIC